MKIFLWIIVVSTILPATVFSGCSISQKTYEKKFKPKYMCYILDKNRDTIRSFPVHAVWTSDFQRPTYELGTYKLHKKPNGKIRAYYIQYSWPIDHTILVPIK